MPLSSVFYDYTFYSAPEIIRHKRYNPIKADIWSLGVLLFALLAAEFPWTETRGELNMQQIVEVQYKLPKKIPEGARNLIQGMIAKKRQRWSIDKIKTDPWIIDHILPSYLPPRNPIRSLDLILVEKIVSLGFDRTETLMALADNKNVQATAIYHNLLERFSAEKPNNDDGRLTKETRTNSEPQLITQKKVYVSKKHSPGTPRRKRKTKNIREIF